MEVGDVLKEQKFNPVDAAYAVSDWAVDSKIPRGNTPYSAEHIFRMAGKDYLKPADVRRFLRRDIKGLRVDRQTVDKALKEKKEIPWERTSLKNKPEDPKFNPQSWAVKQQILEEESRMALSVLNLTRLSGVGNVSTIPSDMRDRAYKTFMARMRATNYTLPESTDTNKAHKNIRSVFRAA